MIFASLHLRRAVNFTLTIGVFAFAFYHFFVAAHFAVNIPHWDEWEFVGPGGLSDIDGPTWFFRQHNEHRIVWTKLQAWAGFILNRWDLTYQITFNFLEYLLLIFYTGFLVKKVVPNLTLMWLSLLLLFFLSGKISENLAWGFQTQFHQMLLFALGSAHAIYFGRSKMSAFLGCLALISCIFSMAGGIFLTLGIVLTSAVFLRRKVDTLFALIWILSVGCYFIGFESRSSSHQSLSVLIFSRNFWYFYLNLISAGMGFESKKFITVIIPVFLICIPFMQFVYRKNKKSTEALFVFSIALGILFMLGGISIGRSSFGLWGSKASRYMEVTQFLPLLAVCVALQMYSERKFKIYFLVMLFALGWGSSEHWNLWTTYEEISKQRNATLQCTREMAMEIAMKMEKDALLTSCPTGYPHPIRNKLIYARGKGFSFLD